jgi:type IV conjugative transfer system protein TraE
MDHRLWERLRHQVLAERYRLWCVVGVLGVTVGLQAWAVFSLRHHVRVVVVPATLHETVWLDHQTVSVDYVAEMARFMSVLYLNTTSSTHASRVAQLLHYAAPEYHGQIKAVLQQEAQDKEGMDVATQFVPVSVRVVPQTLQARVEGEYRTFVGKVEVSKEIRGYQLGFRYQAGQLQLIEFREMHEEVV